MGNVHLPTSTAGCWHPGCNGPTPKAYRAGTHRLVAPEETLARLRPFLAGMGITRVANVTGLDRIGIPVVMVFRPNSRMLAVSQGKGLTLADAKASGLMESIESYHAERLTLPLKYGSQEGLAGTHRLVEVAELSRPRRSLFHPHLPLLWVEGFDLLQQEPVWVPYEMVETNYTLPSAPGAGSFDASTNGLASGNHLLEAVSHGICEIVERDAVTLFWVAGQEVFARASLDLETIDDAGCRHTLAQITRAGLVVGVWETTSDVGVPAFMCRISERPDDPQRQPFIAGFGCHPSRPVALLRALTEAVQGRLTRIAGSRDDNPRSRYDLQVDRSPSGMDWSWIDSVSPRRSFRQVPTWEAETFDEDVSWLLERLRAVGIRRVVVVDLTRPELGLPVVRVIIPGMEAAIMAPGELAVGLRARAVQARTVIGGRA